jgi:hypothetical protein
MKCILKILIAVCLLSPIGLENSHADVVPGPPAPERPDQVQKEQKISIPVYSIAAGGVAVSLLISLVALRIIRKKDEN